MYFRLSLRKDKYFGYRNILEMTYVHNDLLCTLNEPENIS